MIFQGLFLHCLWAITDFDLFGQWWLQECSEYSAISQLGILCSYCTLCFSWNTAMICILFYFTGKSYLIKFDGWGPGFFGPSSVYQSYRGTLAYNRWYVFGACRPSVTGQLYYDIFVISYDFISPL